MGMRPVLGLVAIAGVALAVVLGTPSAASAADAPPPNTIGSFPSWTAVKTTASGNTYQGSADFAAAAGFPGVTYTSNATTVRTPSGDSAFLGASTGFGQYYGSSRSQPYLYVGTAAGNTTSTTTVTFDGAPPDNWGFAVGDIDADYVEIIPKDLLGNVLPGADLNAQDTTNLPPLNYCQNTPKPSGCTGPGPFTDVPTWYPNGTTIGATTYTTPIVKGNGADTNGSYDWFRPGTDVRSLTFVFHVQSGIPIFQLWLAALAPIATITGTVTPPAGETIPSGVDAHLESPTGVPITDETGDPVTTPVQPDGTFTFETQPADYDVAFTVPEGYDPIPTEHVDATAGTDTLPPVALDPAATTPPATTGPQLALTGDTVDARPYLALALTLFGLGGILFSVGVRRGRRRGV